MASTPSIAILFLLLVASLIHAGSEQDQGMIVHEGRCPSNDLLGHIRCRRRVCLPEEMIPLCKGDGDCASTHKCCRTMCSCRDRCIESLPYLAQKN